MMSVGKSLDDICHRIIHSRVMVSIVIEIVLLLLVVATYYKDI